MRILMMSTTKAEYWQFSPAQIALVNKGVPHATLKPELYVAPCGTVYKKGEVGFKSPK
jgi:hypothetical protein|tara:strand:- start:1492 stop:1665 length:174 start_codon:yes stop_codon:yes gene_type:complete